MGTLFEPWGVEDSNELSSNTSVNTWYDDDGDPETALVLVADSDTIAGLSCEESELGVLPAEAKRQFKIVAYPNTGSGPGDFLSFHIVFELVPLKLVVPRCPWADTMCSPNYLNMLRSETKGES